MQYLRTMLTGISLLFAPAFAISQTIVPGNGDIGAEINALQAALPASGGELKVQHSPTGGCYVYQVPIVITKPIILEGEGPSTCLQFTGSGVAVSFSGNNPPFAPTNSPADGFGLRDLTLIGTGPGGGQTGLALGGANSSVGFYAFGVTIGNFGLGLQFNRGVWNFKIEHSMFGKNAQSVLWPSNLAFGGENMEFDSVTFVGATFADNLHFNQDIGGGISNLAALSFISCNFDDAQVVVDNGSGAVRFYAPHFENPNRMSGNEPFLKIIAHTAATDVTLDGPDFYNDQDNPYPPAFIEIDGGPTVHITQMRSLNLDGTTNVPTNVIINGPAFVTFAGDAPLRATQHQYLIASGSPQIWATGGWDSTNEIISQGPMTYSQAIPYNNAISPVIQIGSTGAGYTPAVGFNLPTGTSGQYYPMQIQQNGANELDFCSGTPGPPGNGPFNCMASVVNGVFQNTVPDGLPPISVVSHTPPTNLNAWPATFNPVGAQIQNPHITAGLVMLPGSGSLKVAFEGNARFYLTPVCTLTYKADRQIQNSLTSNPSPASIVIFGQPYIGVNFMCLGY